MERVSSDLEFLAAKLMAYADQIKGLADDIGISQARATGKITPEIYALIEVSGGLTYCSELAEKLREACREVRCA